MTIADSLEDEDLPRRLAAGDVSAFERLFDAYADALGRYVYAYLQSWEDAERVVHDVFAKLWNQRGDAEMVRDLDAHLYTLAHDRTLHLKHPPAAQHAKRPFIAPAVVESGAIVPADAEQHGVSSEIAAAIQRAVDTLSPMKREVLLLRAQQLGDAEIAAVLGIALDTVADELREGTEQLRRALSRPPH